MPTTTLTTRPNWRNGHGYTDWADRWESTLTSLTPFKSASAMSGRTWDFPMGRLSSSKSVAAFLADRDANLIDYAVYSYGTPIAWHTIHGWTVTAQKFSVTTGRHQSIVRMALRRANPVRVVN